MGIDTFKKTKLIKFRAGSYCPVAVRWSGKKQDFPLTTKSQKLKARDMLSNI
jgi:hypothetical protein